MFVGCIQELFDDIVEKLADTIEKRLENRDVLVDQILSMDCKESKESKELKCCGK